MDWLTLILPKGPQLSFLLLKAAVVLLVTWTARVLWNRRKFYALSFRLPGPFALPLLGNTYQLGCFSAQQQMLFLLMDMKKLYGNIFRVWLGPEFAVVISEPEDFQSVLMNKATSWRGSKYEIIKKGMGDGLITLSGEKWKQHRNIINPSFSLRATRGYQPIHDKHARLLVKNVAEKCNVGYINMTILSQRFAADGICENLFDWEPRFYEGDKDHYLYLSPWSAKLAHERMCKLWLMFDLTYYLTKSGQFFKKDLIVYNSFFEEIIRAKARSALDSNTNLNNANTSTIQNDVFEEPSEEFSDVEKLKEGNKSVLMALVKACSSGHCNVHEISDEFNNIYIPGADTIATMVSTLVLLLGMHKRCQDLLWEEIRTKSGGDLDGDVTVDHLTRYPYLDCCYKEVLRMFPTGPVQMRDLRTDLYLKSCNITLPAGTCLFLSNYLLHNNPKYWKDPEVFMPERFFPEEVAKRPAFSFLPYSAGQRNCIGQTYGADAVKTAMIHLVRKFEFFSNLAMDELPRNADISLRSAVGCRVKVTRRIAQA